MPRFNRHFRDFVEFDVVEAKSYYVPSILYYDGLLYMTSEIGMVTCAEASTGEQVWRQRLRGIFFASPAAADNKVYFISETGETFVVRAGREPHILARNNLGERFIAAGERLRLNELLP